MSSADPVNFGQFDPYAQLKDARTSNASTYKNFTPLPIGLIAKSNITPLQYHAIHVFNQDPDLSAYEEALHNSAYNICKQLSIKHPGDNRFLVHEYYTNKK